MEVDILLKNIELLIGQQVSVQLPGQFFFNGILIDIGQDILVLFNGRKYIYIPLLHVSRIQMNSDPSEYVPNPTAEWVTDEVELMTTRTILTNTKGTFVEIFVAGKLPFYGYVVDILDAYFVFYSPVYKTMFISLGHLKWLTPYNSSVTPYGISNESLLSNSSNVSAQSSFEDQLKEEEGKLVVFDGGDDSKKIGLLKKVENNLAEISVANGESVYLNLTHIKSVHLP